MLETLAHPWPWYVAGPLIGLAVPALLLLGNKSFGVSSNLRHICAACLPAKIPFFHYEWKKESWNLLFVAGMFLGAILCTVLIPDPKHIEVVSALKSELATYGITNYDFVIPSELINWQNLFTVKGFIILVLGGFMIGFGTRYAGGCTSGHTIMGLSSLNWPSLVASCAFMAGGILMAVYILPIILKLSN